MSTSRSPRRSRRIAVVEGLTLWPVGTPDKPLAAILAYAPTVCPYRVRLMFVSKDRTRITSQYEFGRELLIDALIEGADAPVGEGTVQLTPSDSPEHLVLKLWQDAGNGTGEWFPVRVNRAQLQTIVDATLELVPMSREHEHLDVDQAIALILAVTP